MTIPRRNLGRTGIEVSIFGLGGEGVLRTYDRDREAYQLINRAVDLGLNYFESARAYAACETYYGLALGERRKEIFLTGKSHARGKKEALYHLHFTLGNMKTDYLDLWQIHDVRTKDDIEEIFGPQGAMEGFFEAREKGFVRYLGITGHHDPSVLRQCLELFAFDTVLLPVNPAEPAYRDFMAEVIPLAVSQEMGIIVMKVYLRGFASRLKNISSLEPFFRFALSQRVTAAVIGCDTVHQLEENARFAEAFAPMAAADQQKLIHDVAVHARNLMYYKP